jgi:hypothetical protein
MSVEYSILDKQEVVAIKMDGHITAADMQEMRRHTVEVNRGRRVLSYVGSYDEAFSWFDDMERRD